VRGRLGRLAHQLQSGVLVSLGLEAAIHAAAAMGTAALKAIDAACPNADFLVSGL